jgi:formylglycine-generating enzyme required for sulfatase activity
VVKNSIGMELVYVPAGSFLMGSPSAEIGWEPDEKPLHQVMIGEGFYIGRYEVTQAQWRAVMRRNPSAFKYCSRCPVDSVSWDDAQRFIRRLNARGDGFAYRLPTEAEWEYACRAGTTTPFAFGSSLSWTQANFDGTFPYGGAAKGLIRLTTTPVGSFQPNAWGLYDMHGNVWEWCEDWHHYSYDGAPTDGVAWLSGGLQKFRVLRGGSWKDRAYYLRSGERSADAPGSRAYYYGFRVAAVSRT